MAVLNIINEWQNCMAYLITCYSWILPIGLIKYLILMHLRDHAADSTF